METETVDDYFKRLFEQAYAGTEFKQLLKCGTSGKNTVALILGANDRRYRLIDSGSSVRVDRLNA